MPDADIETGTEWPLRSCFGMSGQRCLAADNVVVVGHHYGEALERFKEVATGMKMGYGLDQETRLGLMTTAQGRIKVLQWIENSLADAARMVLDGRDVKVPAHPESYFFAPTILEDVNPDMFMAKEEAFGSVASLIQANNLDEAIDWINAEINLGHSAAIMTVSGRNALRIVREVNVGVNV